jgi:hypothetical protein
VAGGAAGQATAYLRPWMAKRAPLDAASHALASADGLKPATHDSTMQVPAAQVTPSALAIAVQSWPALLPRKGVTQPPHDSMLARVSRHSKPAPATDDPSRARKCETGQAVRGRRQAKRERAWTERRPLMPPVGHMLASGTHTLLPQSFWPSGQQVAFSSMHSRPQAFSPSGQAGSVQGSRGRRVSQRRMPAPHRILTHQRGSSSRKSGHRATELSRPGSSGTEGRSKTRQRRAERGGGR